MNPARSLAPALVADDSHLWVYVVGRGVGMILAVGAALALRGRGGDPTARRVAEGDPSSADSGRG